MADNQPITASYHPSNCQCGTCSRVRTIESALAVDDNALELFLGVWDNGDRVDVRVTERSSAHDLLKETFHEGTLDLVADEIINAIERRGL